MAEFLIFSTFRYWRGVWKSSHVFWRPTNLGHTDRLHCVDTGVRRPGDASFPSRVLPTNLRNSTSGAGKLKPGSQHEGMPVLLDGSASLLFCGFTELPVF